MPNLLRGPSPLQIDYAVSLPHSLLATASLLCATARFEGLGDWLQRARGQIAPDLYQELCLLLTFPGEYQRFTAELLAHLPPGVERLSFDELASALRAIPAVHYQLIALRALARGTTPAPETATLLKLLGEAAEWAAYLSAIRSEFEAQTVAALVRDGEALKARLLAALTRFWREVYAREFEATRPLMERSVAYHQAQHYPAALPPGFRDIFTAITGRRVPERLVELLPSIEGVTFVPSCYVGPYVAYTRYGERLIVYYNCRSTPGSAAADEGMAMYPPLKALADETRLQIMSLLRGRELYAQEIVEQLDISQPAVSRHLNLMAAAGILTTRREGSAKYYAIDSEMLIRVAETLRALV